MVEGFDIYDHAGDVDREKVIGALHEILVGNLKYVPAHRDKLLVERLTTLTDELTEAAYEQGYAAGLDAPYEGAK